MSNLVPSSLSAGSRVMIFVDGENLAIRYGRMLRGSEPADHIVYEKGVYVWSEILSRAAQHNLELVRTHYYTSIVGDDQRLEAVADDLKRAGIEAPRLFKKQRTRPGKAVDISLAVEMLSHAHRRNFDAAVLVAGDRDYVPLVEAVIREGQRVFVWFVTSGLSSELRQAADYFFDLTPVLLRPESDGAWTAAFH